MKSYRLLIFDWQDTLMMLDGKLFPDASSVLTELKQRGYLLAVATNAPRKTLNKFMQATKVQDMFAASRCADETELKPDPLMLQEILQELNVVASDAVMIGDSSADLEMSQNAGIDTIAVNYDLHNGKSLARYHPVKYLDNVKQLLEWFH